MAIQAVVFDVMGTLFDLAPLRRRLSEVGAPEGALEAWFGRMLHSAASLTLVGESHPFRAIGGTTLRATLASSASSRNAPRRSCPRSASSTPIRRRRRRSTGSTTPASPP